MRLSAPIYRLKQQAKMLARNTPLPLHEALDRTAQSEGFTCWSHLAAAFAKRSPAQKILTQLRAGDLLLLGARPGQGKTLLGLELAARANEIDRQGHFFSLDYTTQDIHQRLSKLGLQTAAERLRIDTSDTICGAHIATALAQTDGPVLAVVDFLQLLDQRRSTPPLNEQISALHSFAQESGAILLFVAQIDRTFDLRDEVMPGPDDIRLPNPLDLTLFSGFCFLHRGEVNLRWTRRKT